jgi:hypothetical protein
MCILEVSHTHTHTHTKHRILIDGSILHTSFSLPDDLLLLSRFGFATRQTMIRLLLLLLLLVWRRNQTINRILGGNVG